MLEEGMSSIATSEAQRVAAIREQLSKVDLAGKDADTVFLIELVAGLLGFLGVGYLYSGLTNTGLFRLIGYWVVGAMLGTFFMICGIFTGGLGFCLTLPIIPLHFVIAFFSAQDLKKAMMEARTVEAGGGGASGVGGYIPPESSQGPMVPPRPAEPLDRERPAPPPAEERPLYPDDDEL